MHALGEKTRYGSNQELEKHSGQPGGNADEQCKNHHKSAFGNVLLAPVYQAHEPTVGGFRRR